MAGVFINYRGDDSQLSGALIFNVLADQFGEENVFLDCRSIHLGDDFEEVLMRRLRASTVLLCVIGPHWLNATDATGNRRIEQDGDWVRRELHEAFVRGVRVIPIIMDNAKLPQSQTYQPTSPSYPAGNTSTCGEDTSLRISRFW